jgi:hypothetical protein
MAHARSGLVLGGVPVHPDTGVTLAKGEDQVRTPKRKAFRDSGRSVLDLSVVTGRPTVTSRGTTQMGQVGCGPLW